MKKNYLFAPPGREGLPRHLQLGPNREVFLPAVLEETPDWVYEKRPGAAKKGEGGRGR